jgi:hypothetical protein
MVTAKEDKPVRDKQGRLSSESLAALVVDALVDANVVKQEDAERAIKIATEEIDVRKSLQDY